MTVRKFTNQQEFLQFIASQRIPQRQDSTNQQLSDVQSLLAHLNLNLPSLNKFEALGTNGVIPYPDVFETLTVDFEVPNERGFIYAISSLVGCYDAADLFR